tara:strand:+ start:239 stop:661 length:423 start_codon:yes stop_codon:yes gene_type:complete
MAEQAYGIAFSYSADSGSTYTALGEITDLAPPSVSKDVIETTNHGSSGVKTYIGGLVDYGEVSITVNYDPDGTAHNAIRDLAKTANDGAGTNLYKIDYSDAGTSSETFAGIVMSFEQEAPMDGQLSATFGIKVTGTVTYA